MRTDDPFSGAEALAAWLGHDALTTPARTGVPSPADTSDIVPTLVPPVPMAPVSRVPEALAGVSDVAMRTAEAVSSGQVTSDPDPLPPTRDGRLVRFKQASDRAASLASDPATALAAMAQPDSPEAAQVGLKGALYLQSRTPRPDGPDPFGDWVPTDERVAGFLREDRAVRRPLDVVARIPSGDVSDEELQALSAVHPRILADVREALTSAVEAGLRPSPQARGLVARIVGPAADPMSDPTVVSALQSQMSGQRPGQLRQTRASVKTAEQAMTPLERAAENAS